jgi:prophage DNA circulation protein
MPRPTALQRLQRAAWQVPGGPKVEFPVRHVQVHGSGRKHIHEYSHSPGGAIEKLGRKLYEIRMSCPFMETFDLYPNLWPLGLDSLRNSFERQDTGDLTIPTLGTIKAICDDWSQMMEARVQSGEEVELAFTEDQSQLFLVDEIIGNGQTRINDTFVRFEDEVNKLTPEQASIFDGIRDAANGVLAFVDQARAFGMLLQAKLDGLETLIAEADADITFGNGILQDPENFFLWNSLRDLWASANQLTSDIFQQQIQLQTFIVPMTMSIADVSVAIYGDATHAVDLLQTNASFDDAFAIVAGTKINYYPAVVAAA